MASSGAAQTNPVPALLPTASHEPNASTTDGGCNSILPSVEPVHHRKIDLNTIWDHQLRFESEDKQFSLHVGGNAQIDTTWLIGPNSVFLLPGGGQNGVDNSSATFLRRVRLRVEGEIYEIFNYIVEYDFAHASNDTGGEQPASFGSITGSPAPINVWLQVRDVPFFQRVRFGNQSKPVGFSNQVYQGFLPFMERADNWDAFNGTDDNGFSIGLTSRNISESERVTWQYGIYRPLVNDFGIALNKYRWGGRVTGLPIFENDGENLVHLGFGTFNGNLPQDQLQVRARTLLRNGPGYAVPVLVNTGDIQGEGVYLVAPEFAAVYGSWTFQAEWNGEFLTNAVVGGLNQGTVFYHAGYLELLYFLTGEHQSYDKEAGAFGRVVPRNNLSFRKGQWNGCSGGWQIGARFSYIELNDKAVQGGRLYDWTLGLNWFLNPNMKVQLNYILEHRDQPGVTPGWINGVGLRAAFDF